MFQNVRVKQRDGCTVYFQQGRVLCKVDGTAQTVPLFPAVAAARLLMDKASGLKVRVVLEKQSQPFLDLQFSKEGDREVFALQLKQAKVQVKTEGGVVGDVMTAVASPATSSTADTNGSSLLAGARPVKLEDKEVSLPTSKAPLVSHLDSLFSGSDRRGVLSLYSVLDDWVDVAAMTAVGTSSTEPPQLKPLTDHMIADAFAAVPTLAAAHEILVTKRGLSEKEFWTSVVHKYLCFKATPLDSLVGTASGTSSSALSGAVSSPSAGADSGAGAESYIRYINTSSQRPLRLVKGTRRGREGGGEGAADWADENDGLDTETHRRRLDNTKDNNKHTDKGCSSGNVSDKRERTFRLLFGGCTQPFETPASLSWANPPVIRPAHTALTEYDLLVSTLRHIYFSSEDEGGGLATETAASLSAGLPNVESKNLWTQFWKSLDASDYSLAERLLTQATAADAGRPHIAKRAREVFDACRNAV